MGFVIDKRLEIDKPVGNVCMSADPHPINVVNTAPSKTMRVNEIAIETAETGKVIPLVAVMTIYCRKNAIHKLLILG
jgi:hypothetical protein